MPYKDPEKRRAYNKKYSARRYAQDKEAHLSRTKKSRQAVLDLIKDSKDVPCADCGREYPSYVMDFDHRNPEEKLFNIGSSCRATGRLKVLEEIAKCDVVCANCHRERTFGATDET